MTVGALLWVTVSLCHAGTTAAEYELKAEYVWRFTLFVDWPENQNGEASDPFLIGVVGAGPIIEYLVERTKGQHIDGRPVVVRTIDRYQDISDCEIIFITFDTDFKLTEILEFTDGRPILTVAESEGAADLGVLINLFLEAEKVRIEINQSAVQRSGLDFGSKLFEVARIVGERVH